jgi:hypothetical protein
MPTGYIPRADGAFDAWQTNFQAYIDAHYGELGLPSDVPVRVKVARIDWDRAYADHTAARQAAAAARREKDDRRGDYDALIREVVRRVQARVSVTDAQRAALGITVRDAEPTPAPAPTTRPLVVVDFSKRLRHTLPYVDESTPTRRARPRGVIGAEVWVKVAAPGDPPPSGPGELTFLLLSTRTPAVAEFDGPDGGKTAHYMLRWLSTRGEAGPWSETASATIGA